MLNIADIYIFTLDDDYMGKLAIGMYIELEKVNQSSL